MWNNLRLGADADIGATLARLRALRRSVPVGNATSIVTGAALDIDPEAVASGTIDSVRGEMFALTLETAGADPRWISAVLRIGPAALDGAGAVVLIARTSAARTITLRACLRSHPDGGFVDTFFPKRIVATADPSTHLDAIDLSAATDLPGGACERELLLFFDAPRFEFRLLDLRLAIV